MRILGSLVRSMVSDLVHHHDQIAGSFEAAIDDRGPIVMDQNSMRAILVRVDACDVERIAYGTIRVGAYAIMRAVDDDAHEPIDRKSYGAPRRDRRAIKRLRALASRNYLAHRDAAVIVRVPDAVARWSVLRLRRAEQSAQFY